MIARSTTSVPPPDVPGFNKLLAGAATVADRCALELLNGGPARETFDHLMAGVARLRGRYRDLSPPEQEAVWLEYFALEQVTRNLRHSLGRDCS